MYEMIVRAQDDDQDAMLDLIERFKPMLRKYARMLNEDYEDAYSDALLWFIEIIRKINLTRLKSHEDAVLVAYLSKSVNSEFIKKSMRLSKNWQIVSFSQFEEWQLDMIEDLQCNNTGSLSTLLQGIKPLLTDFEYMVVCGIVVYGYKDVDIARMNGKTKQNVSQTKKRAFEKLKNYITG